MMIEFDIPGNHIDQTGNAVPKVKLTRRQYWTPKAQRYAAWKKYVVQMMLFAFAGDHATIPSELVGVLHPERDEKPLVIPKGKKVYMDILISWKDNTHADPENVFGSIADAIFQNDKDLCGSFDIEEKRGKGNVHVRIML
jgi:hypothetical protein